MDQGERSVKVIGNGGRTWTLSVAVAGIGGKHTDRFAPPASGETMTQSSVLKFSLM